MADTRHDAKQLILDSLEGDWQFMDMPQTWVHWPERLTIKIVTGIGVPRDINQPDFAELPDSEHDQEMQVRMLHQGTPFDQLPALRLDGGRITMIKPDTDHDDGTRYLSEYEAKVSQVMSQDDFLGKQGNTIDVEIRG